MIRSALYETGAAIGLVLSQPAYRRLALAIFVPVLVLYLFFAPFGVYRRQHWPYFIALPER